MMHLSQAIGAPLANLMKKEIKTTFQRLLEEKPYHQIMVKEIVQECGNKTPSHPWRGASRRRFPFSARTSAASHAYNSINRDIFDRYLMKSCESVRIGCTGLSGLSN